MMIGPIDNPKTKALKRRAQRKEHETIRLTASSSTATMSKASDDLDISFEGTTSEDDREAVLADNEYQGYSLYDSATPSTFQQRRKLTNTARATERYGISDRAAADIASSVLTDFGIGTTDDNSEVIDRSKLRRERKKLRVELYSEAADSEANLRGLYFDGRNDKTLVQEEIEGKLHRKVVLEEHIVLLEEPGSKYLGHIAPISGNAKSIKSTITDFFERNNMNLDNLTVIGCDGTAVNTGHKGRPHYGASKIFRSSW